MITYQAQSQYYSYLALQTTTRIVFQSRIRRPDSTHMPPNEHEILFNRKKTHTQFSINNRKCAVLHRCVHDMLVGWFSLAEYPEREVINISYMCPNHSVQTLYNGALSNEDLWLESIVLWSSRRGLDHNNKPCE